MERISILKEKNSELHHQNLKNSANILSSLLIYKIKYYILHASSQQPEEYNEKENNLCEAYSQVALTYASILASNGEDLRSEFYIQQARALNAHLAGWDDPSPRTNQVVGAQANITQQMLTMPTVTSMQGSSSSLELREGLENTPSAHSVLSSQVTGPQSALMTNGKESPIDGPCTPSAPPLHRRNPNKIELANMRTMDPEQKVMAAKKIWAERKGPQSERKAWMRARANKALEGLQGLKQEELSPASNLIVGDLLKARGDIRAAVAHYMEALRKEPLALEAIEKLTSVDIPPEKIIRSIRQSIVSRNLPLIDEVVWIEHFTRGLYHEKHFEYQDAIKSWKQLECHFPGSFLPFLHLGKAYLLIDNLEESYFYFIKARLCDEFNMDMMGEFATLVRQNRSKDELNGLSYKLLSISDLRPESWIAMALYSEFSGDRDKALTYIERAIELCPDYLLAYNVEGSIYFALGKWELAIQSFTEANEIQRNFVSYKGLTESCLKSNKHQQALQHSKGALELLHQHPKALVLVGKVILESVAQGSKSQQRTSSYISRAKKAFDKALQSDPKSLDALLAMADCLANSGQLDQGLEILQKSLCIHHNDQLHTKIAEFYTAKEEYTKALQHYHTASSLNPTSASAAGGLEHLDKVLRTSNQTSLEYDDEDES